MGNSPSSGLGSGSAHGLRDVRTADPEAEVERPPASPEPNEKSKESNRKSHEQLPVPQKPYNAAQSRGRKVLPPNSRTSANSYDEVQVPTCSSSTTIQRGAWKSENSLYDRPRPPSNSPGVRPEVRPELRPEMPTAVRPEVHSELPSEVPCRSNGEVRPIELEPDQVTEQAVHKVRSGDAYTNSPGVRPSGFHPNRLNDLFPLLDDLQVQSRVRGVRPDGISRYSYGVRPDCIHMNYVNCPAHAETNESFYEAGSTGARKQADGRSIVRSEPRRTDSHAVGPDTRPVSQKNFLLPEGAADKQYQ